MFEKENINIIKEKTIGIDGIEYSGDTLNTRDVICKKNRKSREVINSNDILKEKAEEFRIKYVTLGNFMPIPVGELNRIKGIGILKDQFDLYLMVVKFFYQIKKCNNNLYKILKINNNNRDEFYDELIEMNKNENNKLLKDIFFILNLEKKENCYAFYKLLFTITFNEQYFMKFNNFENFINYNYLECYIENGKIKQLFKRGEGKKALPQTFEQVIEYMNNAEKLIEERAELMKKKLIEILN